MEYHQLASVFILTNIYQSNYQLSGHHRRKEKKSKDKDVCFFNFESRRIVKYSPDGCTTMATESYYGVAVTEGR